MIANPVDFLVEMASASLLFLSAVEDGRVFLSHGRYEYKFTTKRSPLAVSITEIGDGAIPVCGGNVNTFGVRLLHDGFVLIADVASDTTEILWQASLDVSK